MRYVCSSRKVKIFPVHTEWLDTALKSGPNGMVFSRHSSCKKDNHQLNETSKISLFRFALFSFPWENLLYYFELTLNLAYYWRSEEPAILISMLLLCMCGTYVASVRLGFLLIMSEMNRTQSDHARLDLLSLVIWSRAFWASITWNIPIASVGAKSVLLAFDRPRTHSLIFVYNFERFVHILPGNPPRNSFPFMLVPSDTVPLA